MGRRKGGEGLDALDPGRHHATIIHCEIKCKKIQSQYKLHQECVFLY